MDLGLQMRDKFFAVEAKHGKWIEMLAAGTTHT